MSERLLTTEEVVAGTSVGLQLREQPQARVFHAAALINEVRGCSKVLKLFGIELESPGVSICVFDLGGEERRHDPKLLEKRLERRVFEVDLYFAFGRCECQPHGSAGLPLVAGLQTGGTG